MRPVWYDAATDMLTFDVKSLTISDAMFSHQERRRIEDKALWQAHVQAMQAKIELEPLLPVADSRWPFALSDEDRVFLKIQRIDPA